MLSTVSCSTPTRGSFALRLTGGAGLTRALCIWTTASHVPTITSSTGSRPHHGPAEQRAGQPAEAQPVSRSAPDRTQASRRWAAWFTARTSRRGDLGATTRVPGSRGSDPQAPTNLQALFHDRANGRRGQMRVADRHARIAMSQHLHDRALLDARHSKRRAGIVPEIMEVEVMQAQPST